MKSKFIHFPNLSFSLNRGERGSVSSLADLCTVIGWYRAMGIA
jgi:hypothetical protein